MFELTLSIEHTFNGKILRDSFTFEKAHISFSSKSISGRPWTHLPYPYRQCWSSYSSASWSKLLPGSNRAASTRRSSWFRPRRRREATWEIPATTFIAPLCLMSAIPTALRGLIKSLIMLHDLRLRRLIGNLRQVYITSRVWYGRMTASLY